MSIKSLSPKRPFGCVGHLILTFTPSCEFLFCLKMAIIGLHTKHEVDYTSNRNGSFIKKTNYVQRVYNITY